MKKICIAFVDQTKQTLQNRRATIREKRILVAFSQSVICVFYIILSNIANSIAEKSYDVEFESSFFVKKLQDGLHFVTETTPLESISLQDFYLLEKAILYPLLTLSSNNPNTFKLRLLYVFYQIVLHVTFLFVYFMLHPYMLPITTSCITLNNLDEIINTYMRQIKNQNATMRMLKQKLRLPILVSKSIENVKEAAARPPVEGDDDDRGGELYQRWKSEFYEEALQMQDVFDSFGELKLTD